MPTPEMTATRLCDLFGIDRDSDVWWELKKALAAAHAAGMEEAAKIVEGGRFLTDSSPEYKFAKAASAAIRASIKDQGK